MKEGEWTEEQKIIIPVLLAKEQKHSMGLGSMIVGRLLFGKFNK